MQDVTSSAGEVMRSKVFAKQWAGGVLRIAWQQICLQSGSRTASEASQACAAHGFHARFLASESVIGVSGSSPSGPIVTCLSSLAVPVHNLTRNSTWFCVQALAALRDVVAAPLRRARGDRLGRLREGLQRPAGRGGVLVSNTKEAKIMIGGGIGLGWIVISKHDKAGLEISGRILVQGTLCASILQCTLSSAPGCMESVRWCAPHDILETGRESRGPKCIATPRPV